MRISNLLFRFRFWILFVIFAAGFWAPLDRIGGAHPGTAWLFLAGELASHDLLPIAYSSIFVMAVAILLAVLGALLRTWAEAYMDSGVVHDGRLRSERLITAGPYRYVRNPLYIGLWMHSWALAVLMPPGGAVFTVAAITILVLVLVHIEEQHLAETGGEAYIAYRQRVPKFVFSMRPRIAAGLERPDWKNGFLNEIYMWGVAITYIAFASRYNATILEQGILISLGIGIVARGILRPRPLTAN